MFGLKKYFGLAEDVSRLGSLVAHVEALTRRIIALEGQSDYHEVQLDKHEDAAGGGFWKTASGHLLRIRDMSTDHIKRCLAGNFAKPNSRARGYMETELQRRDEEDYWRGKPMPVEPPTFPSVEIMRDFPEDKIKAEAREEGYVGLIDGTPVYVDENVGLLRIQSLRRIINRAKSKRVL